MKRIGNLFEKVYDFENIHKAYLKARRNKRYRHEVLAFTALLEENLSNIQNHLIWKSYQSGEYRQFKIFEPKERLIMALPFVDRVAQHCLINILEPLFDKTFIYHSYACRKNKGAHRASAQLVEWLYNTHIQYGDNVYCIKADISKYFQSIDHDILKNIIRHKIKCNDTLWLIDKIIDHNGHENKCVGIPVGNLTSQLFANVYLGELDKYAKEVLHIKYYMRYMDDFLIISDDKEELKQILLLVENFLSENLKLSLNPKTYILKVKNGVDFVGYRHWHTHKKLRKSNIKRIRLKIKHFIKLYEEDSIDFKTINNSVQSWLGHIKHADTYSIRKKILSNIVLTRKRQKKTIKE